MSADLTIVTDSSFSKFQQQLIQSSVSGKSNVVVLAKFFVKFVLHSAAYLAFEYGISIAGKFEIMEDDVWFSVVPVASMNMGGLVAAVLQAAVEIFGFQKTGITIGVTGNMISGAIGGAVVAGGMVAAGLVGAIAGLIISGGIWCVAELIGNMCRRDIRH